MAKNRFLLGQAAGLVALGAAAGSALALLFAPTSGRMLRKKLGGKARNLSRATTRQIQQAKRLLAKKAGLLRHAATDKLEDTREWFSDRVIPSPNGKRHALPRRVIRHA